jgi:4-hydroxybenzoate polyprenyltransferase
MNTPQKDIVETADAIDGSWVYRNAPNAIRPYLKLARMDRPVGTWLLLWPCWWSLSLAGSNLIVNDPLYFIYLLVIFGTGALAMRGAGCTYNDIVDRDFDGQVERTKSRPIPAGEITIKQAWFFLVFQCLIGLLVLLQLGVFAIWVGLASLILVAIYPFMKRITYWPQAWLGLTFNWGALVGWATINGSIGASPVILYFGCLFWTLGYDTVYAHQDKEDDAMVGVKSTALALGTNTKPWLLVFYGIFTISLFLSGLLANAGVIYYISASIAGLHLGRQILAVDIDNPDSCLKIFRSNIFFGWIIFAGIIADTLLI